MMTDLDEPSRYRLAIVVVAGVFGFLLILGGTPAVTVGVFGALAAMFLAAPGAVDRAELHRADEWLARWADEQPTNDDEE